MSSTNNAVLKVPVVVSFDVGIKNLAVCILSLTGRQIFAWTSLNLVQDPAPTEEYSQCCKCCQCKKRAVFKTATDSGFCKMHAGKQTEYLMPVAALHKKSKQELQGLLPASLAPAESKADAMARVKARMLSPIVVKKPVSASAASLIDVARQMTRQLDALLSQQSSLGNVVFKHVLVENQISPIANRMKTIQGFITEYFVIRYPECAIQYVSSANKLRDASVTEIAAKVAKVATEGKEGKQGFNKDYGEHKKSAVAFCRKVITEDGWGNSDAWIAMFDAYSKKDDLADSFLQGAWFVKKVAVAK